MEKLGELFRWLQPEIGRGWPKLGTDQNRESPTI